MKFEKLEIPSGAVYEWAWDDHCIVLKSGERKIWIEPLLLPELIKIAWVSRVHELDEIIKMKEGGEKSEKNK